MVEQGKPDYGRGDSDRRLHILALTAWQERLNGRPYPTLAEFNPSEFASIADNSFLLDIRDGLDKPVIIYAGSLVEQACGETLTGKFSTAISGETVFFHIADHFVEIIANQVPIGFEAEFDRQGGETCRYRGILLPLSDCGDEVEYIVGVMNWVED